MLIHDDVWVTVRYRLFDAQGEAIEQGERELTYLQGGYGTVFPRIEQALEGHGVGYATSVHLEPEEGFGEYDPERVRIAPRALFPDELEVGMTFEGLPSGHGYGDDEDDEDEGDSGRAGDEDDEYGEDDGEADDDDEEDGLYIVTDFTDEAVVLDGNHPLAGMALRFDLRVTEVRSASAEEVRRERLMAQGGPSGAEGGGDEDEFEADEATTEDGRRTIDRGRLH